MKTALSFLLLLALISGGAYWQRDRIKDLLRETKAKWAHDRFVSTLDGVDQLPEAKIAMPDGVHLATDVYLPPKRSGPVPTVFMRLPYGKSRFGEVRKWMRLFLPAGYAIVVQDMRGRYGSEGVFAPYPNEASDGAATLDWIAAQGWSDGQVGTIGCSALGETQVLLATRQHPSHTAMIPMGAGGAIGTLDGDHGFFGFFEGGIFSLASGFGWFVAAGGKTPDKMGKPAVDYAAGLATLPLREAVSRFRSDPTDFRSFLDRFDDADYWQAAGFIDNTDQFSTPFLIVDGWYDGARESLKLATHMRKTGAKGTAIILPGLHCDLSGAFDQGSVGDLPVDPAKAKNLESIFLGFFDHKMKGQPAPDLPPLLYYVLGEDRWRNAQTWPPEGARPEQLFFNGSELNGTGPDETGRMSFVSDPANPVPTIGGAICCTGDPDQRAGPLYQTSIESRTDLLLLTGAPLEKPLRLAGPITARLFVSTDVPDTDLVMRLTDVDPQGRSRMIHEGALRLRYRNGMKQPQLMKPGTIYEVAVDLRDIAYQVAANHRLRVHIAGSSFPRLARNMNSGGAPYAEDTPRSATITVHYGPDTPSQLGFFTLPDGQATQ